MKKILVAVILCMLMTVTACKKDNSEDNALYAAANMRIAFSEDGIFYIGKDELVHFISAETKEDMIFCMDPSCEHKPYHIEDNPDPKCRAALFGLDTDIAYYDGALYYFVNVKFDKHKIYKMQVNEAGRKSIADVSGRSIAGSYGVLFCNDHVYYVIQDVVENEETFKMDYYPYIVDVSLSDGSSRRLTQKDESLVGKYYGNINVCGNTLIAEKCGKQRSLIKVDLTTLENTVLIPIEEYSNLGVIGYSVIGMCDEEYYYCSKWDENYKENTIYKKSSITGKEKELLKGSISTVSGCGDAIYYRVDTGDDFYSFESYYYDIKNNKRYNITESEKKYGGFMLYEGHSKKFMKFLTELDKDIFPDLYEFFCKNKAFRGGSKGIVVLKDGELVNESYDLLGYAVVDLSEILEGCKAETYKP